MNKINKEGLIKCECGNDKFLYYGEYVRCTECGNEYKQELMCYPKNHNTKYVWWPWTKLIWKYETWLRRFNNDTQKYNNWEKYD